jgi:hypothetical protein
VSDVPVRPQAIEAVMIAIHQVCYPGDYLAQAKKQAHVAIQAFLAAEEIGVETHKIYPPHSGDAKVHSRRLCGPWRRDDG